MKTYTKKEVKNLYDSGKLSNLTNYVISNGTKADIIDALQLLLNKGSEEYDVRFESLPYSRGGKYARHTSALCSTQKWEVVEGGISGFYIYKSSTSKSAACPSVVVPKFYTEIGKKFFNDGILDQIEQLKKKLL